MTYQEAIERLKKYKGTVTEPNDSFTKAKNLAIYALEKQVPKKPTHEATLQRCNTCPCCCQVIDTKVYEEFGNRKFLVRYQRCVFCGQAIDWSDEE